jgi:cysteine desulfurase
MFGGQERGLRPGRFQYLCCRVGLAAELCVKNHEKRLKKFKKWRKMAFEGFSGVKFDQNSDEKWVLPHFLNVSFDGINSEALMLALKGVLALSNGSACTSSSYEPSHVLKAMGLSEERIASAVRLSWCHMTPAVDWAAVCRIIQSLR